MVARLLPEGNLHLGHLVAHIALIMVQMLLEQVEQHRDMGCAMDILQLVAGELGHNDAALAEVVEDVEQRDANVAGQDAAWQQMVYQTGGGGLALGAGNANGHVAIYLQKEVGQRR